MVSENGSLKQEGEFAIDVVKEWLTRPGNNQWLLIFDELDDLDSFNLDLQSLTGSIIITSRNAAVANLGHAIALESMSEEDSVKLLATSCQREISISDNNTYLDAVRLVQKLGGLPLAISHAGTFAYQSKIPLGSLLQSWNESYDAVKGSYISTYYNATVLESSYQQLFQNRNPSAAGLLDMCSFFSTDPIPLELLMHDAKGLKIAIRGTEKSNDSEQLFFF